MPPETNRDNNVNLETNSLGHHATDPPPADERVPPREPDDDEQVHQLRQLAQAYPDDVFLPLTDEDRERPLTITRASAAMGRHFSPTFAAAAARIRTLTQDNEDLQHDIARYVKIASDHATEATQLLGRIRTLTDLAEKVTQWDWSDNDVECVRDVDNLRRYLERATPDSAAEQGEAK